MKWSNRWGHVTRFQILKENLDMLMKYCNRLRNLLWNKVVMNNHMPVRYAVYKQKCGKAENMDNFESPD